MTETIDLRASQISIRLLDRGREQAGRQLAQRLTATAARCQRVVERLQGAALLREELERAGLVIAPLDKRIEADAKRARTQARSTATRLESTDLDDAESLKLLDATAFQAALQASELLVDRLAATFSRALEAERVASLPEQIGEPIPEVPGKAATVIRLQSNAHRLSMAVTVRPEDLASDTEAIIENRRQRIAAAGQWDALFKELAEALEAEDPAVRTFLTAAASSGGAPLALLSDDVRARLASQELLDEFRVHRR